ncbi:hypothetical protein BKA69DRAFT_312235 [Paraphysoderma sedebokerense]|nr:hypothetical protein BKA69DRAFT_312235 [Paraphysoderma sedebokerense]
MDTVTAFILFFVLVSVLLLLTGNSDSNQSPQTGGNQRLRRGRHNPTPDQIQAVQILFPQIPVAAIELDLSRTGSVEATCDNILRNGSLPTPTPEQPPAASTTATSSTSNSGGSSSQSASSSKSSSTSAHSSSVSSFISQLSRSNQDNFEIQPVKKDWSSNPNERQQNLMTRKQAMVLEARKKYLEKMKQEQAAGESQS